LCYLETVYTTLLVPHIVLFGTHDIIFNIHNA
jgi:hypothetical protein